MGKFFDRALAAYAEAEFTLQMRARLLLGLCMVLAVLIPIIAVYTFNVQVAAMQVGEQIDLRILLTLLLVFLSTVGCLVLLICGRFSLSAHLLLIAILLAIGAVMTFEQTHPISRLDSIVLGVTILSITPLVITRHKYAILLYGAMTLIFLYGYMHIFRGQLAIPDYAIFDYLSDNTVAIVVVSLIAYSLFAINEKALARAKAEIQERRRAEETVQSQKAALETTNQELSTAVEKMALTTREYEEANAQLIQAQAEILTSNARLQESEEKFSKAFHLSPLMIGLLTLPEGRFVDVSDHFCRVVGYVREQVLGRTSGDLNLWTHTADYEVVKALLLHQTTFKDREVIIRSSSGELHTILLSAELVTLWETPHVILVGVDITERKLAEEEKTLLEAQLRQAQRMESIGRLAGGVAHDFNNLLTAILGNTGLVMMRIPATDHLHDRLKVVMKAAESAADLTRQLLAFSRKQIIEPKNIDPALLIENMRGLLARLIGEDIHLEIMAAKDLGIIKADPGQLEQILVNLAVNARDAMPDGGRLNLELSNTVLGEAYKERHPYATPGEYVLLAVSDTGCGMSAEVQQHLFEPFFTTKPLGKGTGLGLATVYGAVKQNGGSIEVYSEPGSGTTIKIYFPRLKQAVVSEAATGGEEIPRGTETILLVEDSPLVLDFAKHTLQQLGYTIIAVGSGEEALSVLGQYPRIHLLLTDVILPGMNGRALADRLVAARPDLRVLYASGYTENAIVHHGVLEEGIHFIGKPYTTQALARKIREVLEKETEEQKI